MKFNLEDAIEVLSNTPTTLGALLNDLSEDWTQSNEGPDTWSPYDVVGHLIHGEKTDWIPRLEIILGTSQNKTFQRYDRFAQFKESTGKSMQMLLKEFEQLRAKNLNIVRSKNLNSSQMALEGIHPELGAVSLSQLLAAWVVHDQGHIVQISRVIAKQYSEEVGPWTQYLTILQQAPKE